MNEKRRLAVVVVFAICCHTVSAGDPLQRLFGCQQVPDCVGRWCGDDYCSKKEPCVCVPFRFQCDDYCSKKEPCVCPKLCFTCDDYCKKCLPKICSPPRCDVLSCGPRCYSSGHSVASRDNSLEKEPAKVAELPVLSQMSNVAADNAVVDESDKDEFDAAWRSVTVEVPEFAFSK